MDFLELMKILGLVVSAFIIYRLLVHEQKFKTKGHYTRPAWNFFLKKIYAEYKVKQKRKADLKKFAIDTQRYDSEAPKILPNEESSDSQLISGNDDCGNQILIKFTRRRHRVAEVLLFLRLSTGQVYTLPNQPNTTIVNATPRIFEGAGLKLECLVPFNKFRITFSGILRRGVAQDVSEVGDFLYSRFNFIWVTASDPKFWPFDWSPKLIATSLATEQWRDGKWMQLISKKDSGGYDQFGACHGQVRFYEHEPSIYVEDPSPKYEEIQLNLPGLRQRRWGPNKSDHLHRTGVLIGSIKDGVVFEVGALSGKAGLTHTQFGNIRFPDYRVVPIEWTDFHLASLGEYQNHLPQATIVQMKAGGKTFIAMVTFKNHLKVPFYGGSRKESWNAFLIPIEIKFNTVEGFGVAIFWYPKNILEFDIQEIPTTIKRIFNRHDKPSPEKLLLSFVDKETQSVLVSGGKGASLAILRVIQETKGEDFLDKRNRSQQILNALVDTVSSNPMKRSIRVQSLIQKESEGFNRARQRSGSIAKTIFPDPHDFDFPEFYVPQGFVISVSAYERHVCNHPALAKALKNLEDIVHEKILGDIKEACKKVQDAFAATSIDNHLSRLTSEKLKQINFDGGARFAVRSSGVTEDSEESSAAGQNETFLGLTTDDDVFRAIIKCWASLYGFQSVHYRKQHIQPICTAMAVVVQKMVDAEAAGVMFTRHPINGDVRVIIITANYGLGESVVSAKSEPDTFYVRKSLNDDLAFLGATVGAKKTMVEMDSGASVKETELTDEKRSQLCLSEDICLKLAKLGVIMEKFFGTPRDIEFAIMKNGKIYLLQSRPITALNNFTEYELVHENDSAVMSVNECFTKANIGEVILGSSSVFSQSALVGTFERILHKNLLNIERGPLSVHNLFFPISHHQTFMHVGTMFLSNLTKEPSLMNRVAATSVFGCDIYSKYPQLIDLAIHQNSFKESKNFSQFVFILDALFTNSKNLVLMDETVEKVKAQFNRENVRRLTTAKDIFEFIERGLQDVLIVLRVHIVASNCSIISQMFSFATLLGSSKVLTIDHQQDIALILGSTSNVESANVPEMIQSIAGAIMMAKQHEKFLEIDRLESVEWLRTHCKEAFEQFEAFMKRHGHRSINELDYIATPWNEEPELIIDMIKTNLRTTNRVSSAGTLRSKPLSDDEILDTLKTQLGSFAKLLMLKIFLPRCRKGVQDRENAKSKAVFVVNEIRQAVKYLAEQMVKEGMLPDKTLIFHLSIMEIKDLIASRDGKIVQKAFRRQKLFPKLNELKFSEITFGVPKPIEYKADADSCFPNDVLVKGVPVCGGTVVGPACVCKSFADAQNLQKGDILITYGTDIGWSPYFPILAGVCTEIGGIISHGAVVAREYGLPCIVGATSATDFIKNGQKIKLNATDGTITAI